MSIWPDFWSAFTAIGTIAMAVTTFFTIRQGRKILKNDEQQRNDFEQQRKDTERQHQDSLKPICCLMPYGRVDQFFYRGNHLKKSSLDEIHHGRLDAEIFIGYVEVLCLLKNIGVGPAINIRFRFRFIDMGGLTTEPCELAPLGAGDSYGGSETSLLLPIRITENFNKTAFNGILQKSWEILLDYEDVFGNKFQTVHSKQTFQRDYNRQSFVPESSGQADWGTKVHEDFIPWMTYHEEKPSA